MTISAKYASILANLTHNTPHQIDPVLFGDRLTQGTYLAFPETRPVVSADLWTRAEVGVSYIGIRVLHPISDPHELAADLAAVAMEQQIIPVFLSWVGDCGMQRNEGLRGSGQPHVEPRNYGECSRRRVLRLGLS